MKKLVVILTIAVVATGAVATKLWLDLRAEHTKAGEIATRLSAAESMQLAQAAAPQPASVIPAVAAIPQPAAPSAGAAPAIQKPAAQAADSPMKGILEAMATPENLEATRTMMRRAMVRMYPNIEQELGITAQEKEKLFDLLSMQDEDQDIAGMMAAMQDPAAAREMQRKSVEIERAQEAKISALLGSKYQKWEEYQGTVTARSEVDQLRRTLSVSKIPLSEAQTNQLVTAFAVEARRNSKEDREWNRSPAAMNSPNLIKESMQREVDSRNRLVNVASPILDAAQLDKYKQQVEQEANMMRMTMEMMTGGSKP